MRLPVIALRTAQRLLGCKALARHGLRFGRLLARRFWTETIKALLEGRISPEEARDIASTFNELEKAARAFQLERLEDKLDNVIELERVREQLNRERGILTREGDEQQPA